MTLSSTPNSDENTKVAEKEDQPVTKAINDNNNSTMASFEPPALIFEKYKTPLMVGGGALGFVYIFGMSTTLSFVTTAALMGCSFGIGYFSSSSSNRSGESPVSQEKINSGIFHLGDNGKSDRAHGSEYIPLNISPEIDSSFTQIFSLFIRDFFENWYSDLTCDKEADNEIKKVLSTFTMNVYSAVKNCKADLPMELTNKFVNALIAQLRDQRLVTESGTSIRDYYASPEGRSCLHYAARSQKNELTYVRQLCKLLTIKCLPKAEAQSNLLCGFVQEMLSTQLIIPTVQSVTSSDYVNEMILYSIYGTYTLVPEFSRLQVKVHELMGLEQKGSISTYFCSMFCIKGEEVVTRKVSVNESDNSIMFKNEPFLFEIDPKTSNFVLHVEIYEWNIFYQEPKHVVNIGSIVITFDHLVSDIEEEKIYSVMPTPWNNCSHNGDSDLRLKLSLKYKEVLSEDGSSQITSNKNILASPRKSSSASSVDIKKSTINTTTTPATNTTTPTPTAPSTLSSTSTPISPSGVSALGKNGTSRPHSTSVKGGKILQEDEASAAARRHSTASKLTCLPSNSTPLSLEVGGGLDSSRRSSTSTRRSTSAHDVLLKRKPTKTGGVQTLSDILRSRTGFSHFMEFMVSIGKSSYLKFWENADNFKKFNYINGNNDDDQSVINQAKLEAFSIFTMHFSSGAPFSVDIPKNLVIEIEEVMNKANSNGPIANVFVKAQEYVYTLMNEGYLLQFKGSDTYSRYASTSGNAIDVTPSDSQNNSDLDLTSFEETVELIPESSPDAIGAAIVLIKEQEIILLDMIESGDYKGKELKRLIDQQAVIQTQLVSLTAMGIMKEEGTIVTNLTANVIESELEYQQNESFGEIVYILEVGYENDGKVSGWMLTRSYVHFTKLYTDLCLQFPKVKKISFPPPIKKEYYSKRRLSASRQIRVNDSKAKHVSSMNLFLQLVLSDELLAQSAAFQSFLGPHTKEEKEKQLLKMELIRKAASNEVQKVRAKSRCNNNSSFSSSAHSPMENLLTKSQGNNKTNKTLDSNVAFEEEHVHNEVLIKEDPITFKTLNHQDDTPVSHNNNSNNSDTHQSSALKNTFTNDFSAPNGSSELDLLIEDVKVSNLRNDKLICLLFSLIDEVFELNDKNKWLRRKAVNIMAQVLQQTYGTTIGKKFAANIHQLMGEENLQKQLQLMLASFWPNGRWASAKEKKTPTELRNIKHTAREALLAHIPDVIENMVGKYNCGTGCDKVFETLQDQHINKHLFYVCLDEIILHLFAEDTQS